MSTDNQFRHRLGEASRLIRSGRSANAIPILDNLIIADPTCMWALEQRGRAKMFTGNHEAATEDFTRMITQWPANPKGFTCRAQARAGAGDLQRAIDDYSSAIAINTQHPYAYLQRGRLRAQSKDYPAAVEDFTLHMTLSSDLYARLSGLLNRGRAKHAIGDLVNAITDLTEAISLEGERPIFGPLFRGRAKCANGDLEGAIADFTAALNAFPGLTNAYRHRAEVRALLGDQRGALDDQQRYQQLGGHDLPAYL